MSNRFLEIDGESTEAYGLLMLDGSEPYKPAPVTSRIVEIAGSSRHVDATEFSTGHPEYSPVTGEHAEFLVEPSLLGMDDTREGREAIVTAFVREVHGQCCEVVDSLHPLHTMECRCQVDVDEHSGWRTLSLTWTRQAVRRMADGTATLTSPWEQAEFDPETAVGPLLAEPNGFDTAMAGWEYALVEERPWQATSDAVDIEDVAVSKSTENDQGTSRNTWYVGDYYPERYVVENEGQTTTSRAHMELSAPNGAVTSAASAFAMVISPSSVMSEGATFRYTIRSYGHDGTEISVETQLITPETKPPAGGWGGYVGVGIPAGTRMVTLDFEAIGVQTVYVDPIKAHDDQDPDAFFVGTLRYAVQYGDPGFDYTGYYVYRPGYSNPMQYVLDQTVEDSIPSPFDTMPQMTRTGASLYEADLDVSQWLRSDWVVVGVRTVGAPSYAVSLNAGAQTLHFEASSDRSGKFLTAVRLEETLLEVLAWQDGLVFTASETALAVPGETVAALGQPPAFHEGLYFASYGDCEVEAVLDSDTGYPSALSVEASHPCAVTLGGRSVSLEEGEWTTDLLMERGDNEVSIDVPATGAYDEDTGTVNDFTANLTWRRGDL